MFYNTFDSSTPSDLPRILCLHGGGTNARIFRKQCRVLIRRFSPFYRLVFAEAPWSSSAGPDVLSVYAAQGPFKRWLRWHPNHPAISDDVAIVCIEDALSSAMAADDALGHDGDWAGLLGFSQGGKIAASVLYETQLRRKAGIIGGFAGGDWRFAVLLAARAPLVALSEYTCGEPQLDRPGELAPLVMPGDVAGQEYHRLEAPTVHVHGLKDTGVDLHRVLLEDYVRKGTAEVIEWAGDHRVPITPRETEAIVQAALRADRKAKTLARFWPRRQSESESESEFS